ncbi:hypothetical protein EON65_17110 [archaeon]|nr:MAG: hypothetical protein EON65_17110 [archaeon]
MLTHIQQGLPVLTDSEVQHVGEEIADVFIYATRLCDVCGIDLGHSIDCALDNAPIQLTPNSANAKWRDISFDAIYMHKNFPNRVFESQRQVALQLQAEVGKMSACFTQRSEAFHTKGLVAWTESEKHIFASIMGSICLLLCVLAKMTGLRIGQVIADKFEKNERKYPVSLAKGSSAKYTAYTNDSKSTSFSSSRILNAYVVILAASLGLVSYMMARSGKK